MNPSHSAGTMWSRIRDERGNCFLYGCVTLVILAILGGLIAFILARNLIRDVREKYTEAQAVPLPTIDMPQDEILALIKRVDAYAADLRANKPLANLTLTEKEVNALLQNHPDLKKIYGGVVYVTLGEDEVTTQLSVALDWIPGMRGRFFNGAATFDATLKDEDPDIYLKSAVFKGEEVPDQYLQQVKTQDFSDQWDQDPDARTLIRKIESAKISPGSVTIIPKNKIDAGAQPAAAPSAPAAEPAPAEPAAAAAPQQ